MIFFFKNQNGEMILLENMFICRWSVERYRKGNILMIKKKIKKKKDEKKVKT